MPEKIRNIERKYWSENKFEERISVSIITHKQYDYEKRVKLSVDYLSQNATFQPLVLFDSKPRK